MRLSEIDSDKIKIGGRTIAGMDPVTLIWTGSYVEFRVKAGEFKVLVEGPFETYENWIAIEVNGEIVSRRMISKDKEWITVFRMRNPETVTDVKIIKEVQAFPSDSAHRLNIYEIETDGELLPVEEKKLKIEFIGDSITSAEGCAGAKSEMDWVAGLFSHINSYPYMLGKKLDADIQVFSQSGWGVYCSWDCNIDCAIPRHYEKICSVMDGEYFAQNGFCDRWDFGKWQPDAIIINLGTNDDGAFHNSECDNHNLLGMDHEEYIEEDRLKVRGAIADFLKTVRDNNPKAYIYWGYGMIGDMLGDTIREAIRIYSDEYKDSRVSYIALLQITPETTGSRNHPGKSAHEKVAEIIEKEIKSRMQ